MATTREVFAFQLEELLASVNERREGGETVDAAELRALWREALSPPSEVRASKVLLLQWALLYLRSWNAPIFWSCIAIAAVFSALWIYQVLRSLLV